MQGWKGLQLYQEETPDRCFPLKFEKILRTHFSTEHLQWLLLKSRKFLIFSAFPYDYVAFLHLLTFLFDKRGFTNNPNFILFKWRLKESIHHRNLPISTLLRKTNGSHIQNFDEHADASFSQDNQATHALAFNALHSNIRKYVVITTKKVGNK